MTDQAAGAAMPESSEPLAPSAPPGAGAASSPEVYADLKALANLRHRDVGSTPLIDTTELANESRLLLRKVLPD
jgi:hypothetical protein